MNGLTFQELRRYARHLNLPGFGPEAQLRLKNASVLCVGAGGLGSPALMYLAAAGVGRITVVDPDTVDESNLQRQVLFGTSDIGTSKADAAAHRLQELNPYIQTAAIPEAFDVSNAESLLSDHDVLMDGADNFPTRYLCNDAAFFQKKPNVHASIFQFDGQCSVFAPHLGAPCYRCLFPDPPSPGSVPDCASGGVLGVLPGLLGTMQALQVIELITGIGSPLLSRLFHLDALTFKTREIKLRRDPQCPLCGDAPVITELAAIDFTCAVPAPSPTHSSMKEIQPAELRSALEAGSIQLIDVREPWESDICRLEQARLIPLNEVPARIAEIPRDGDVAVICRGGVRSARAIEFLESEGYTNLINVAGGMNAWREQLDPDLPDY